MYGYIYLILNKLDGRTYVGKRKLPKNKTWSSDKYMGSGCHLKNSQNKYGIENFEKFFICYTDSEEDACQKEIFWIKEYRNRGKAEYNFDDGGNPTAHNKGKHFSEYVRKRMSEAKKGKPLPWITSEVGKKSAETRKSRGYEPWNKGKKGSQVAWNKGKKTGPLSEETKRKMSDSHKGKCLSDEERQKMLEKRNQTLKEIGFHSNKGKHWKLVNGKRTYFDGE